MFFTFPRIYGKINKLIIKLNIAKNKKNDCLMLSGNQTIWCLMKPNRR